MWASKPFEVVDSLQAVSAARETIIAQRMRTFTELALADGDSDRMIRSAATTLTARPTRHADATHDAPASNIRRN